MTMTSQRASWRISRPGRPGEGGGRHPGGAGAGVGNSSRGHVDLGGVSERLGDFVNVSDVYDALANGDAQDRAEAARWLMDKTPYGKEDADEKGVGQDSRAVQAQADGQGHSLPRKQGDDGLAGVAETEVQR